MPFSDFWKKKETLKGASRMTAFRELYNAYKERWLAVERTAENYLKNVNTDPDKPERKVELFELHTVFGVGEVIEGLRLDQLTVQPEIWKWFLNMKDLEGAAGQYESKDTLIEACDLENDICIRSGSASTLEWLWNKYRQIYGLKYISLGSERSPIFGGGNNPFFSYSVNWNTLMIDVTINTPPHGGIYPQGRAAVGLYLGYGIGEVVDDPVYTEFVQSAVEFTNGGGGLFRLPFRNGFNGDISIALRPPWEFFVL